MRLAVCSSLPAVPTRRIIEDANDASSPSSSSSSSAAAAAAARFLEKEESQPCCLPWRHSRKKERKDVGVNTFPTKGAKRACLRYCEIE